MASAAVEYPNASVRRIIWWYLKIITIQLKMDVAGILDLTGETNAHKREQYEQQGSRNENETHNP